MKTQAVKQVITGPRINVMTYEPTGLNNIQGLGQKALKNVRELLPVMKGEAKEDKFFKQHTDKVINIGRSAKSTGFESWEPLNEMYIEVRKKGFVNWLSGKRKHTEVTKDYNSKEGLYGAVKKAVEKFQHKETVRQRALNIKKIRNQKKKVMTREIQDSTMPWLADLRKSFFKS